WSEEARDPLRIPAGILPTIVDSSGIVGEATALPGAPPIAGIAGDQQASLLGQGCVHCGDAKITFGTGGMLDLVLGGDRPPFETRGPGGTFPIVCRRIDGGMSANPTFVQALADAGQRIVEVSPVIEATTLGAAFLAGLAVGTWRSEGELAATWSPRRRVEPQRKLDRGRWREACRRAA